MLTIQFTLVDENGRHSDTKELELDKSIGKGTAHQKVYVAVSKLMDAAQRKEAGLPEITGMNSIRILGYRRHEEEEFIPYHITIYGPEKHAVLAEKVRQEKAAAEAKRRQEEARLAAQPIGVPRPASAEGVVVNPQSRSTADIAGVDLSQPRRG